VRAGWQEIWRRGAGTSARLVPQARMVAGALLCASCLSAEPATLVGSLVVVVTALMWIGVGRATLAVVVSSAFVSMLMTLPLGLLAAFAAFEQGSTRAGMIAAGWDVLGRSLSAVLISISTIQSLSESDFQQGLTALYRDVLGFRSSKLPVSVVVADLSNRKDAGLKKALARVKRATTRGRP
jgi:hypothetical protein